MEWESTYGFCAYNETDRVALAKTLEALRRMVCAYGGGNSCDCKYGLTVDDHITPGTFGFMGQPDNGIRQTYYRDGQHHQKPMSAGGEQTGCPELREIIHRLLHRDTPLI